MAMEKRNFLVDYTYKHGSSGGRMKIQGSSLINLQTAQSDFAVYEYIKDKTIMCKPTSGDNEENKTKEIISNANDVKLILDYLYFLYLLIFI
jgi:hypothetical protein